jgi:uncharacterized repeat protein (TIGR03943 family)
MKDLARWRTLFLLSSAMAIGGMWSQGRLESFLHPRYAALLPWAALVLLAMGLVELAGWGGDASGGSVKFRHVVWFLPFALGLALRPDGFSGAFASSRGPTAVGRMLAQAPAPDPASALPDSLGVDTAARWTDSVPDTSTPPAPVAPSPTGTAGPDRSAPARPRRHPSTPAAGSPQTPEEPARASLWCDLPAPKGAACVDTLRERFWYEQMLALYMEPSRHRGRRVRLVGRAQRDGAVEPDGWHVGRMMIWCCAADASPLGLYLVGPVDGEPLSEGTWVAVEGRLDVRRAKLPGMSRVRDVPVLRGATAAPIEAPQQENVFPFSY